MTMKGIQADMHVELGSSFLSNRSIYMLVKSKRPWEYFFNSN
jgi:hypothetical protein